MAPIAGTDIAGTDIAGYFKTSPDVNGPKLQFFVVGTDVRIVRGMPFSIFPKIPSALTEFATDSYRE